MTSKDQRAQMVPKMQEYETALLEELAATQVTKIDLAEYQPGQPHYEALIAAMEQQVRYQWPGFATETL